jgi:hypothetical protein|tara:strand:- start:634 stop:810 length:177 start_codon:yes stop_codon:yes gene_type:complete
MNEYVVVQVWNNIQDITLKYTTDDKENALSVLKKYEDINNIENGDKTFAVFTKVKILK